ncbi:MFS transporter [Schaedlerella arabinosiphila]|jgi:MFS family permease|uniref:MFS transporter n=2 Tax=Schaedlerella arabinosiphila TaxID=2044587 RepID=A0A3R8KXM4_9FIRM|nr:MFS transporter [Schaedlerella arabinosiphila]
MRAAMQNKRNDLEKRASLFPDGVYLGLLMLAYVIVGINTYRLQPVLTTLMDYLSADTSRIGFLMSLCTFVTLCLAIPFGVTLPRLGCRRAMILAVFLEIAGSVIGFLFPTYGGIAVSQILFGLTNTMATVCAPYLLQMVYDKKEFSVTVGYLNACQTVGMAAAFLILPLLLAGNAVPQVWFFTVIPSGLLLLTWIPAMNRGAELALQQRADARQQEGVSAREKEEGEGKKGDLSLKKTETWLAAVSTFFIMFSAGAVLNFASSFLTAVRGIPEGTAARIVLSSAVVGMVCSAFVGIVCNQAGRRIVFIAIVIILALLRLLMVVTPTGILLNLVIALQGVPAAGIVVINTLVPDLCPSVKQRPLVISMISTASMAGMCLSSIVFGMMIRWWGYDRAFLVMVPVSLLALVGVRSVVSDR